MRLAEFILSNREPILKEWEAFARTCTPASGTMDITALRDHANAMLTMIARDLATPQDRQAQAEKSKKYTQVYLSGEATAAEEHGAARAESGFTIEQMVAEYRALRASVIRLWTDTKGQFVSEDFEDLNRFNEAIDQAVAESIAEYNQNIEQSREMFLGILGHDLRTPLAAIQTSARFMLETEELEEPHRTLAERIARSAARSMKMVGDLLDFTRSRLGPGIPTIRTEVNLGRVVRDVVDEICDANPECSIEFDSRGEQRGEWDSARLAQALENLIANAVQYSAKGTPVTVSMQGDADQVSIAVHNHGVAIPHEKLSGIFKPMKDRPAPRTAMAGGPTGSLGLGLFIAERIINAHGGRIDVASSEAAGTTFTVRLPRHDKGLPGTGDGDSVRS